MFRVFTRSAGSYPAPTIGLLYSTDGPTQRTFVERLQVGR